MHETKIRVTCPGCKRAISVLAPGLYTCKQCGKVMRIEGRVQAEMPLPFAEPIPLPAPGGRSAELRSLYLGTYSKFAQAAGWMQ